MNIEAILRLNPLEFESQISAPRHEEYPSPRPQLVSDEEIEDMVENGEVPDEEWY